MLQAIMPKALAAVAAIAVSTTAAHAAPAVKPAPAAHAGPVKMSDQKLDSVTAGTGSSTWRSSFTVVCSFGNNCSGNGGSYNGNSKGLINVLNGTLAGSAILSGNAVYVF